MESQSGALGVYLSELRAGKGYTATELARRLGVRRATVSEWLAGKRRPVRPDLLRLLDLLHVSEGQRRRALSLHKAPTTVLYPDVLAGAGELKETAIHGGDLLRALRMRRGWTQERTAQAVEVSQSLIGQWETGLKWPNTTHLHTLCRLLKAREEELVALTVGVFAQGDAREDLFDMAALTNEFQRAHAWPVTTTKAALMDLNYLSVATKVARFTFNHRERLEFLIDFFGAYAERLYLQQRYGEAISMAKRALKITQQTPNGTIWPRAMIRWAESYAVRGDRAGLKRGLALLDYWSSAFDLGGPTFLAWERATRARLLSRLGDQEALSIARKALQIVERDGWETESVFRRMDYAQTLLDLGRAEEAQEAISSLDVNRVGVCLLQGEIHRSLGDPSGGREWLTRARQNLQTDAATNAHETLYFAARIESLEEKLHYA